MIIDFTCAGCGKSLKARPEAAGKSAICPQCNTKVRIPSQRTAGPGTATSQPTVSKTPSSGKSPSVSSATGNVPPTTATNATTRSPSPTPAAQAPTSITKAQKPTGKGADSQKPAQSADFDAALNDLLASDVPKTAAKTEVASPTASRPPVPRPTKTAEEKLADAKTAKLTPFLLQETPLWLRHLHWFLALALIPLAVSLVSSQDRDDIENRIRSTLANLPEEEQIRIASILQPEEGKEVNETDFFSLLPGGKIEGAWLPRGTYWHWALALASTALFMSFFLFLAVDKSAKPTHLLAIGFFTATIGIFLLLSLQVVADASANMNIPVRGVGVIILLIVKFIGFSYSAALNPDNGFWLSFFGFTCGVGFCEEVVKALPLLCYHRTDNSQSWRGAFLWGLASGAGFGIAEGLKYSAEYYNGLHGSGIYLVRFLSCVALHALWAGSIGITTQQNKEWLQVEVESWYEYLIPVLRIVAVPMVLHGLYDTLLKKQMNGWALVAALASFAFLAFQISRLRGQEDEGSRAVFLRNYALRRRLNPGTT